MRLVYESVREMFIPLMKVLSNLFQQQYRDVQLSAAKLHTNTAVTGFDDSDENTCKLINKFRS